MAIPIHFAKKRPVVVQAVFLTHDRLDETASWCGGTVSPLRTGIDILTLEGTMRAQEGDWIIRGVKGEFYPCKPEIFDITYELMSNEEAIAAESVT